MLEATCSLTSSSLRMAPPARSISSCSPVPRMTTTPSTSSRALGIWLQPYFEKGVLVSPSQHGQGGVTKDFTVEDWQKISVMSWKTEQAQKDMESIP